MIIQILALTAMNRNYYTISTQILEYLDLLPCFSMLASDYVYPNQPEEGIKETVLIIFVCVSLCISNLSTFTDSLYR